MIIINYRRKKFYKIDTSSDSQNPMRYIDTAMELARKNINPMAPPNSGPKENIFRLLCAV